MGGEVPLEPGPLLRFGRETAVDDLRVDDHEVQAGHLFGVSLAPRNRWGGFKALRDTWHAHIEATLLRPVLVIDEAQEMGPAVLSELRLLVSAQFDSRALLTVVLAGDGRLAERFQTAELQPLASRIRVRVRLERAAPVLRQNLVRLAGPASGGLVTDARRGRLGC